MGEDKFESYQRLNAWQKSDELSYKIYKITDGFPKHELFGLVSQMRRAAVSVPANIAEGYASFTNPEKKRYYNIARSSLSELNYYVYFSSQRLGYLNDSDFKILSTLLSDVGRLITGLVKSVS